MDQFVKYMVFGTQIYGIWKISSHVFMDQFVKYMVFGTQIYGIWKISFNVETYMSFMHSEPVVFFLPRLPLLVSRSATTEGHVSTGWNWTGWKLQNQMLSFPQKHPSRRFFLPSFSFDTHSSQLSSLRHQSDLRFPEKRCSRPFKTLADGSFFLLSHSIPILLICLHFVSEAIWASQKNG